MVRNTLYRVHVYMYYMYKYQVPSYTCYTCPYCDTYICTCTNCSVWESIQSWCHCFCWFNILPGYGCCNRQTLPPDAPKLSWIYHKATAARSRNVIGYGSPESGCLVGADSTGSSYCKALCLEDVPLPRPLPQPLPLPLPLPRPRLRLL